MSLTWVVKTNKGGHTLPSKQSDGLTPTWPLPFRMNRFVEIGVEYGCATPCDVHCLEAFIVELQAAVKYLNGND